MKPILAMISLILFLAGCTPNVGMGIGGVAVSGDGMAASEILVDSETGVHGSITMGTDMRL